MVVFLLVNVPNLQVKHHLIKHRSILKAASNQTELKPQISTENFQNGYKYLTNVGITFKGKKLEMDSHLILSIHVLALYMKKQQSTQGCVP